jgi:outer membrane beta-barrel protein
MSVKSFILLICPLIFILTSWNTRASESSIYSFSWLDPDKEVYVLQNRKFRKAGRMHASAGYGMTTSGAFVDANSVQGRLGFFALEDWGAEVVYAKNSGTENTAAQAVRNNEQSGGSGSAPFRRMTDNYLGAMVLWSPFYAKINTFNKIVYLDWYMGLGVAKLEETNNKKEIQTRGVDKTLTTESHTGVMWNTGFKFYINEYWHVRVDFTGIHYKATKANTTLANDENNYNNCDLTLGIGINI